MSAARFSGLIASGAPSTPEFSLIPEHEDFFKSTSLPLNTQSCKHSSTSQQSIYQDLLPQCQTTNRTANIVNKHGKTADSHRCFCSNPCESRGWASQICLVEQFDALHQRTDRGIYWLSKEPEKLQRSTINWKCLIPLKWRFFDDIKKMYFSGFIQISMKYSVRDFLAFYQFLWFF